MNRLIRDTDIIRKLNNLIEAIEAEPENARYAIIVAVEGIDGAYDVEAVVRELEDEMNKCYSGYEETCGIKLIAEGRGYEHAIEIVKRGGRNE